MGRARKRARREQAAAARASGAGPSAAGSSTARSAAPPRSTPPDDRPWADAEWRRAERRRVLLLSLLPGPPQRLARRGRLGLAAVIALQIALVLAVGLLLCRSVSGEWLPSYAGIVVLAVAVAGQFACRAVNSRTGP